MSVKVREYKKRGKSGWEVDIMFKWPDGELYRERVKAPVGSKSGAKVWGERRQAELLTRGKQVKEEMKTKREVPTVEEFFPRFIEGYAKANRQKPSGVDSKESHFRNHLLPRFGTKRLDALADEDVQKLKAALQDRSVKTVNNCLSTLSTMLKVAVKWKVIERMPVEVEHLKAADSTVDFYEVEDYERLVQAAEKLGPAQQLAVLLGGDAGLRMGEMIALEWSDVDLKRGLLKVQRSDWKGHVNLPKGGRPREVPLTRALASALVRARHLRGERVLYREDGTPVSQQTVRSWMSAAQKRAGLKVTGALHILRHTFCSHLAMRGVPPLSIKELAGHRSLRTTMRYMHLGKGEKHLAIQMLEEGRDASPAWRHCGDEKEPESTRAGNR
ncbi:tyrosine-type recombinase/integrase [Corallococcus sp. AS-1-6]|uniref:tyrosine-type recombinase/integrase n=1 Tax=Corallococcus sp. AS-1-6 TaxID=2874599 RepID=UPI001CC141CF|nr:tyrosine-type recombinase/integrase [Corallococcus sp. AS-1-6]MBZ4376074.1 tyrosine-type recombinase/integrase [Corallococcus sp. AS-1-6]